MTNIIPPDPSQLPSPERLRLATVIAVVVAVLFLIVVVLPAEKGIDPTGLGRVIGFTEMGEMKVALAKDWVEQLAEREAARLADSADAAESTAMVRDSALPRTGATPAPFGRTDITVVTVPASGDVQLMFELRKNARIRYSWSTDRATVDYAIRGDSLNLGSIRSYSRGFTKSSKVGVIVAAFDGPHGWYFRNTTDSAVKVTVQTSGDYTAIAPSRARQKS